MRAANQLPGRVSTDWMLPLYLHLDQTSDGYDDDMLAISILTLTKTTLSFMVKEMFLFILVKIRFSTPKHGFRMQNVAVNYF